MFSCFLTWHNLANTHTHTHMLALLGFNKERENFALFPAAPSLSCISMCETICASIFAVLFLAAKVFAIEPLRRMRNI